MRDPGFYNIVMSAEPGSDRQKALASAANQLRKETKGATAVDHDWFLFPQHPRHSHWAMIAVEVPTMKLHWLDSLVSHDIDHTDFKTRTNAITSVLISAWAMTYHSPSPK